MEKETRMPDRKFAKDRNHGHGSFVFDKMIILDKLDVPLRLAKDLWVKQIACT